MRILVTGFGGFVAGQLVRDLAAHGHEVWGTGLHGVEYPDLCGGFALQADITSDAEVRRVLERSKPEAIVHLAAQSNPTRSWDIPEQTHQINVIGTMNLVQALGEQSTDAQVIIVSSSDVYGRPDPSEMPLRESSPLRPLTPYAASKCGSEQIARVYGRRLGVRIVVARPFSHTGPGQRQDFVVPAFARQVARVETGLQSELLHGNLDSHRDFTDVRDVVRAYRLIVEARLTAGTFNVCSGRSVSIRSILETLCSASTIPVPTRFDHSRFRPEKGDELRGDATALQDAVGWEPQIPFEQTLLDVLQEQREQVGCGVTPRSL